MERCRPLDDGNHSITCASFCNAKFASTHCTFCACADCSYCTPPVKAPQTPAPAKAPQTPAPVKAPQTSEAPAKAPHTPAPVKAPQTSAAPAKAPQTPAPAKAPQTSAPSVKAPQTASPHTCKPMDSGETERSCAAFCRVEFARVHCPFCACSKCDYCASSAALRQALAPRRPPPPQPPHVPPPPPSPRPPPQAPLTLVQRIDGWWRNGRPSNSVTEAGTLIRQLDELNRKGFREWEPGPADLHGTPTPHSPRDPTPVMWQVGALPRRPPCDPTSSPSTGPHPGDVAGGSLAPPTCGAASSRAFGRHR
jgi:hypothetical protein